MWVTGWWLFYFIDMAETTHFQFESQGVPLGAQLVTPDSGAAKAGVVCVTGGLSDAETLYTDWQHYMAEQGIASLAFDARGKGRSEGVWENGAMFGPVAGRGNSQFTRVQDTANAVRHLADLDLFATKPSVIGTSMGGDVTLHVADQHARDLSSVVLKAPAAYHPEVHARQFGVALRHVLHSPERYPHAVAPNFGMLRRLRIPVQVIFAAGDQVISPEIKDWYYAAANSNPDAELIIVGDSTTPHGYFGERNPVAEKAKRVTIERTTDFILKTATR